MASGIRRPRDVGEAIDAVKKMPTYARLIWGLARDPRVPLRQKAVLGAIAAYLAFPIDIIPDFIPVIGELDDLVVVLFGLDWFLRNAPADVVDEHLARIATHDDTLTRDLGRAESVLGDGAKGLRVTLERIRARGRDGESE